jgi:hypothetical protein
MGQVTACGSQESGFYLSALSISFVRKVLKGRWRGEDVEGCRMFEGTGRAAGVVREGRQIGDQGT